MATWYRFKALGEQWVNASGVNNIIKYIENNNGDYTYQYNGYSYFDFLTDEVVGTITFDDGNGVTIEATQVQVTLQETTSSGTITAGELVGELQVTGYAVFDDGEGVTTTIGTLNLGSLPAFPGRYAQNNDILGANVKVFADMYLSSVGASDVFVVSTPILSQLTIDENTIDLTGINGSINGYQFPLFNFEDGETYTFSITWGELVEAVQQRKLRVKGVGQLNP